MDATAERPTLIATQGFTLVYQGFMDEPGVGTIEAA